MKNINFIFIVFLMIFCFLLILFLYEVILEIRCAPLSKTCRGNNALFLCGEEGRWSGQIDTCDYGCFADGCLNTVCEPNGTFCVGHKPYKCNENGSSLEKTNEEYANCEPVAVFSSEYDTLRKANEIPDDYLFSDYYYDLDNEKITELADELKVPDFPLQSAKNVFKWTHDNIDYRAYGYDKGIYCVDSKASEIVEKGYGVCSHQSRVNTAILRKMGIAAIQSSGCAKFDWTACYEYAAVPIEERSTVESITTPEFTIYNGRKVMVLMNSGAHAWVKLWVPEYGWIIGESTTGNLFQTTCTWYDEYTTVGNVITKGDENSINSCFLTGDNSERCENW